MEVALNTILGTAILRYVENEKKKSDTVTDFIFLGITNTLLYIISDYRVESPTGGQFSNRLSPALRAAYYPTASALTFSAYSNMMYNNSYIRSMTISAPIAAAETYLNYQKFKIQSAVVKSEVRASVPNVFNSVKKGDHVSRIRN